ASHAAPPASTPGARNRTPGGKVHRRSHTTRPGPGRQVRGLIFRRPPRTPGRYRSGVEYTGVHAAAATYLDAATTAPLHPVGREALLAALDDGWADPERLDRAGRRAGRRLGAARGG